MVRIITLVGIVVVAVAIIVIASPSTTSTPKPKATHAPCSSNSPPCIKITQQDGTVYKLNDFRFLKDHCISFISLPDRVERQTCNEYKLDWIGAPEGTDV